MRNPADVLISLDGQRLEIDFGLPSPLLGDALIPGALDLVLAKGQSITELLANLARPNLADPAGAAEDIALMHRHFLDPLALDFWPFPHYYSYQDFMRVIRSICLRVSTLRLAGYSVVSSPDHPGAAVVLDVDLMPVHRFEVEGRSGGSIASMTLRAESLANGLASSCAALVV